MCILYICGNLTKKTCNSMYIDNSYSAISELMHIIRMKIYYFKININYYSVFLGVTKTQLHKFDSDKVDTTNKLWGYRECKIADLTLISATYEDTKRIWR